MTDFIIGIIYHLVTAPSIFAGRTSNGSRHWRRQPRYCCTRKAAHGMSAEQAEGRRRRLSEVADSARPGRLGAGADAPNTGAVGGAEAAAPKTGGAEAAAPKTGVCGRATGSR